MTPQITTPWWVRLLLVLLGLPTLLTGLWAVSAPQSWYDDFPGYAPRLISAIPPFNEHLATDAGAGLLAVGLVALVAAAIPRRDVILTAMVAFATFAVPHALYHLANPIDSFSTAENISNTGSLVLAAAVALGLLFYVLTRQPIQEHD